MKTIKWMDSGSHFNFQQLISSQALKMTSNKASTETVNKRQHSRRLIHVIDQGWYLRTREGLQGPFKNQQDAQQFLENHVQKQKTNMFSP